MLNCHSYYSYKFGTLSIKELISLLSTGLYPTAVLTDINNTSMAWDFVDSCQNAGVKPILGIDFRNLNKNAECLYIGIAKNNEGFMELNTHLSFYLHSETEIPAKAPYFENAYIVYPYKPGIIQTLGKNEFLGIRITDFNSLRKENPTLLRKKAVALHSFTFKEKDDFYTHCLLRTMFRNTLLSKLQRSDCANKDEYFVSFRNYLSLFEEHSFLVSNAMTLLESCSIEFNYKNHKNKSHFMESAQADRELLLQECLEGLEMRYPGNETAKERLLEELKVIDQLNFTSYFLTVWDLVRHAQREGFFYVGRGSGANSVAAYCLKITEVDPIELNLFFERFLNLHRNSPPDFDMDFSWKDRDKIIEYLFKKHGNKFTAMLGSHNTFKFRALMRELGKVYGLPNADIESLINNVEQDKLLGKNNTVANMDKYRAKILYYSQKIMKFPHYLSVHACGVVVSELPIHYYSATEVPPKGFQITHFDMYTADKMKLHKLDILSQRGLGHIKDCIEIVKKNKGEDIDIFRFKDFKNDSNINQGLKQGKTIGCFYIESPAMRHLIRKLECDNYLTLVAASSIIRPGVTDSGMGAQFIIRHNNPKSYIPIHPKIDEILGETYGIMVYQEDVIKVAHFFAGMTLAEADMLRRAMAWKFRVDTGFEQLESLYFSNCAKRGYPLEVSKEVWRQMEGFAGFSFCKAHSASYAVESYQSLYLKTYYPLEFIVAILNNFGGFYYTEFYINEARRAGAIIHPPCINTSEYLSIIIGKDIYLGFILIDGLEKRIAENIQIERKKNGIYHSIEEFCQRLNPGFEQINLIIKVGAFNGTGKPMNQLYLEALLLYKVGKSQNIKPKNELFPQKTVIYTLTPKFISNKEQALNHIQLLGFPLCSRFDLLKDTYKVEIKARDFINNEGQIVKMVAYLTNSRIVKTKTGKYMQFGSFIDDENETFETVLFPPVYKQFPLGKRAVYALKGKVIEQYGVQTLEVIKTEMLEISFD